ncbi:unnamed protein product [Haemonchus placei]|uniref:Aminotran_5 domain-containing protein n=1 Tax=Haemonchus placei TaxID=6290 RepID=A0A0N4WN21_HAEPC|nr:unnamed protein product [Haemonchus placei]
MSAYPPPASLMRPMEIPPRQLFGPGPSNMRDVIAESQSKSLLGHLHPEFIKVMSDAREGLQYLFKTKNNYTFAVSGTGVRQPLEGLGEACARHGTLLLVDTVASIGGAEFRMDEWGVDCVYAATQKVLNAPPGLAPISFSDKAM